MFGYIVANKGALSPQQLERYRGCYCGLCWTLKERHGTICRMTLNYDMTFLVIALTSMYEEPGEHGERSCAVHPTKKHSYWKNEFTDYAADMTVSLAYFNCLDDWKDDKNLAMLAVSGVLKSHFIEASKRFPRQTEAIEICLGNIAEIEKSGKPDPDAAANYFGELMGELFVYHEDMFAERFRLFGQALGRFIYMMDACVDYEKDKKHGSYNPLLFLEDDSLDDEEMLTLLKIFLGECTAEFERLPLIDDVDIMRNVLYSGVWTQYAQKLEKNRKGAENGK